MKFGESFENLKFSISSKAEIDYLNNVSKEIAKDIKQATKKKKFKTIFGNRGSAADAQDWAAKLTYTYKSKERDPFLAKALTTDTSILPVWSNDVSFNDVFRRQFFALAFLNDLIICLSTLGASFNFFSALKETKKYNVKTVLILGASAKDNNFVDLHIKFNSTDTPTIQILTHMLYHSVCEFLE